MPLLGSTHFRPDAFNGLIAAHGVTCLIFPVLMCPCRTATLEPDPICPICQGTTRYYLPELAYSTTLDLQQESSQRNDLDPGLWEAGTIQANIPTGIDITTNDKIRVLAGTMTFTELCVRDLDDTLRFTAGVELLAVADREHGLYRANQDYRLQAPASIEWLGQAAPLAGAQYSVRYKAYPEYLVVSDTPRMRIEHNTMQVQEVTLRLFDKAMPGL